MTDLSLVIRNARIVDGTGAPGYAGDLGIAGDRIAAVGRVEGRGAREIDAGGKVVAPGFIDIHTHYDPQLCWDRLADPSPLHGVTTLIIGNCSISLAPVRREQRHKLIHLFGSVEDMEGRLLESTVPFEWESVGEYLDYLRRGLGPNVGMFVGHSVLRLYVMGAAAQQRAATDAEIAQMAEVLRGALRAGAFGLSYSYGHLDEQGNELPCHFADRREKLALMQVMAEEGRGMVEATPQLFRFEQGLKQVDEFGELALETGVTCTISPLLDMQAIPGATQALLAKFEGWQAKGAPLYAQTQTRPLDFTVKLSEGSTTLSKIPAWRRLFDLELGERERQFRDPEVRKELEAGLEFLGRTVHTFVVKRGCSALTRSLEGRRVSDIAAEQGKTFTDTLLDLGLGDGLQTEFAQLGLAHADPEGVARLLDHPGIHIGSADAGAHITQFSGVGDTGYLFQKFVRERGAMSVERAVQRLSSDLARGWGIADRGEIAPGKYADLVVFDPHTIGRGEETWADDVPGGSGRYVRAAFGIGNVIVNGQMLVENNEYTANRPGRIV